MRWTWLDLVVLPALAGGAVCSGWLACSVRAGCAAPWWVLAGLNLLGCGLCVLEARRPGPRREETGGE